MKIRTKVAIGLVIMAAMIMTANGVIVYNLRQGIAADEFQKKHEIQLDRFRELQLSMNGLLMPLKDHAIDASPKEGPRFSRDYEALSHKIQAIKNEGLSPDGEETIQALEAHLHELQEFAGVFFAVENLMASPQASSLIRTLGALSAKTVEVSKEITEKLEKERQAVYRQTSRIRNRLLTTVLFATFLLIGGGLFGAVYLLRTVSRPVRRLLETARQIAEGDFSKRLDQGRRDEFGTVNGTFNYMLDVLQQRENTLVAKNRELNRLIKELESSNEERQLTNEELESTNEELQISNEELESTNEELNLSNQELEIKTRELGEARELLEARNREIKEAHDYLESIIRYTHSGICVIGRDYKIESVNHALEEMAGYTESELIGSHCYQVFHGASEPCPGCPTEQTFTTGSVSRFSHKHLRSDGKVMVLDIATTPLFDKENHVVRVIETMNDVTEVTRLTREVQEQKERIKSILMNMGEGVSVIRSDYEIEFVNDVLKRRFGEIAEQKCYKAFRGFAEPCPGEVCSLHEVLTKGKKRFEVTKKNEDGRFYRMTSVPLRNPDGTISMIQIRQDVTAQKEFEEERNRYTGQLESMNRRMEEEVERRTIELKDANAELRLANERLKALNREKSDFIDIAVHDLRTPLTSILSYADILLKYKDEPAETRAEFLDIIIKESFRMKRLIDDYLDLSKLEAGFVDFEEEELDILAIIKEILPPFEARAGAKGIRMTYRPPPSLPSYTADSSRIRQVFANLIDNAVKYTPAGGEITILGEVLEKQKMLRFTVQDSGIGMDEKDHGKLFQKFERIMDRDVRKQQGSGLGLAIVKTIVEHYGGNIQVKSKKGKGSSFTFSLPLDRGAAHALHVISTQGDTSKFLRDIVPLWKDCLERNYACAYFGAPLDIEEMKETLSSQGLNTYDLMDREQIIFSPAREPLLKNGRCNGEHLYECAANFCERIIESTWEGLMVVRDMSRLSSDGASNQEFIYFEKKINYYLRHATKPIIQICRYHGDHFSHVEISNLIKIHPYRFQDGKIVAGSA